MKITREVNGVSMDFELTEDELWHAHMEQQDIFDRMDVDGYTTGYYTPEDFKDVFGVTVDEFDGLFEDVVSAYRDRRIDTYEDVHDAAFSVIQDYKNGKKARED